MRSETFIPFKGFYGSSFFYGLEAEIEMMASDSNLLDEELKELCLRIDDKLCYANFYQAIAKTVVSHLSGLMAEKLEKPVKLTFMKVVSPREYNFSNDRILCKIGDSTIKAIYKGVDKEELQRTAIARHTSHSGFISFYNTDLDSKEWGEVLTWDANQLETLLIAFFEGEDFALELEGEVYEILACNGFFSDYLFNNCSDKKALERLYNSTR